ncbi:MAG: hypothetical protein QXK88_01400 [Desulfurococcaceae archaeon]
MASSFVAGIALALVVLTGGAALFQHARSNVERVASMRIAGALPVTAIALRFNSTHNAVIAVNYGSAPRAEATVICGESRVKVGALGPGECKVLYVAPSNATCAYADSEGILPVKKFGE